MNRLRNWVEQWGVITGLLFILLTLIGIQIQLRYLDAVVFKHDITINSMNQSIDRDYMEIRKLKGIDDN